MDNEVFIDGLRGLRDYQEPHSRFKATQLSGQRKKQEAEYRAARVETLRRLYEENPVEEEKVCTYSDPVDKRRNCYEMDAIEENPYSPFNDLELLEEKMPDYEDFI